MQDQQDPQVGYSPAAPPTIPGALSVAAPPAKWSTVLGVIGIVFGVFAVLGSVGGIASVTVFADAIRSAVPQAGMQMDQIRTQALITNGLALPLAAMLAVAGVGLIGRRPWSISTSKIWAVLKCLFVAINVVVGWNAQKASFQSNPVLTNTPAATAIQAVSLAVGLIWGLALPVFMLIWLSRDSIKAQIAQWK